MGDTNFVRLEFIDFDARREPKTDRWCIRCQKDLRSDQSARSVRALLIGGGPYAVHPEDVAAYEAGTLALPPVMQHQFERDLGECLMGADCAQLHGMEWTLPQ